MLMSTLHKLIGNNVLIIQEFECSQRLNVYRKEKDAIFFQKIIPKILWKAAEGGKIMITISR